MSLKLEISKDVDPTGCQEVLLSAVSISFGEGNPGILKRICSLDGFSPKKRQRFIARSGDKTVGFVDWLDNRIEWLMVRKEFQHRGIGSVLLDMAEKEIPEFIDLLCVRENIEALKFYESHGYTREKDLVSGRMFGHFFSNIRLVKIIRK